jgi:putative hydrolase of HD superfamily
MLPTLIEVQRLKRLDRTGWTLRGLANGTESVAAHSFGVTVAAMFLGDEIKARGVNLDLEKVLRMALLHDLAETRVGDLPRTAVTYFGKEARRRAEMNAFADVIKATADNAAGYRAIYEEYETRETLEAQVVKAADIIDLLIQALALERGGAKGLDEFWEVTKLKTSLPSGIAGEVVSQLVAQLLEERQSLPR